MRKNTGLIRIIIAILLIIVIIIAICWAIYGSEVESYSITGTVEDKLIVPSGDRDDPMSYVIWLTNGQKLELRANLFHGTNEDDLWRQIKINSTYIFECWGWRVDYPALGFYWYPNVFKATEMQG